MYTVDAFCQSATTEARFTRMVIVAVPSLLETFPWSLESDTAGNPRVAVGHQKCPLGVRGSQSSSIRRSVYPLVLFSRSCQPTRVGESILYDVQRRVRLSFGHPVHPANPLLRHLLRVKLLIHIKLRRQYAIASTKTTRICFPRPRRR